LKQFETIFYHLFSS